jgi:hypothetical protein
MERPTSARFPDHDLETLRAAKIVGVRSGTEHRHTAVWMVVVEGRVFVRSWNDKPTGWYRAFREQPRGALLVAGQERSIRALAVRSVRLRRAVSASYASKYNTKASATWVRGFAEPQREATTLELVPLAMPPGRA